MSVNQTNLERAETAWTAPMPDWVRRLATACDADNQRVVAQRLRKSSGYVSRLLNRKYEGSYEEAETLVRAAYGIDEVDCPIWGAIPLKSCVRMRRRTATPQNMRDRLHADTCPTCPLNTDREN